MQRVQGSGDAEMNNGAFEQWFEAHKRLVEEGVDYRVDPEQIKAISEQCFLAGQKQAAARGLEILISHENCGEMEHGGRYDCITTASGRKNWEGSASEQA